MTPLKPSKQFVRESARYLGEVYPARLEQALATLPAGDLWWRPHEGAISLGTILLHLEGNVRQWVLSGIGGAEDRRERAAEFAGATQDEGAVLLGRLAHVAAAAADLIQSLPAKRLREELEIQGFETTVLGAVYHVVEHFSWHTGQAVWIAKARSGAQHGLAFFDDAALAGARNRPAADLASSPDLTS